MEQEVETKSAYLARECGMIFTRLAFAFVFLYFGAQKPLVPGASPVREPVTAFLTALGVPLVVAIEYGGLFIGLYEMTVGVLFLFNKIRAAALLFIIHQLTTLVSLLVIPYVAFREPWFSLFGVQTPYALDWFSAYVLKNLIFIGAFMLLFAQYHSERKSEHESDLDSSHTAHTASPLQD